MFRIELCLPEARFTGIEALDLRRQLGLPDHNVLEFRGELSPWVEVDESFARAYFQKDWNQARATVTIESLAAGDIEPDKDKDEVKWPEDLSEAIKQRHRRLFIKFRETARKQ